MFHGTVYCRCLKDDKCNISMPSQFDWIKDGYFTSGMFDPMLVTDRHEVEGDEICGCGCEEREAFYSWSRNVCAHEHMELASQSLSSHKELWPFRDALKEFGKEKFSTLISELPDTHRLMTSPKQARRMLSELQALREMTHLGRKLELVDSDTGEQVYVANRSHAGEVGYWPDDGIAFVLTPDGFFVKHTRTGNILFHSVAFEQRHDERSRRETTLVDIESGRKITIPHGVGFKDGSARFHVEWRERTVADLDSVTKPLAALCNASVETGNVIVWTD